MYFLDICRLTVRLCAPSLSDSSLRLDRGNIEFRETTRQVESRGIAVREKSISVEIVRIRGRERSGVCCETSCTFTLAPTVRCARRDGREMEGIREMSREEWSISLGILGYNQLDFLP